MTYDSKVGNSVLLGALFPSHFRFLYVVNPGERERQVPTAKRNPVGTEQLSCTLNREKSVKIEGCHWKYNWEESFFSVLLKCRIKAIPFNTLQVIKGTMSCLETKDPFVTDNRFNCYITYQDHSTTKHSLQNYKT